MEAIRIGKEQGKGAVSLHGKMIDAPIVARAQQTLPAAKARLPRGQAGEKGCDLVLRQPRKQRARGKCRKNLHKFQLLCWKNNILISESILY